MLRTARDPVAAFNERVKLFAGFINAIGIGIVGFAILRPLTDAIDNATIASFWWGIAGLALHAGAHYILRLIRKETTE